MKYYLLNGTLYRVSTNEIKNERCFWIQEIQAFDSRLNRWTGSSFEYEFDLIESHALDVTDLISFVLNKSLPQE